MIYISKGLLLLKPSENGASISHCGVLHKLTGEQATLWLAGQYRPGYTDTHAQGIVLKSLAALGIVEYSDAMESAALFRLLINCVICPARAKKRPALLSTGERILWRWIRWAGLRLTIAELTLLAERGIKPAPALLGEENRQTLTESIYTAKTIFDGILETLMETSPARDGTVKAVLGLLRKKKVYLI